MSDEISDSYCSSVYDVEDSQDVEEIIEEEPAPLVKVIFPLSFNHDALLLEDVSHSEFRRIKRSASDHPWRNRSALARGHGCRFPSPSAFQMAGSALNLDCNENKVLGICLPHRRLGFQNLMTSASSWESFHRSQILPFQK